MTGLSHSGVAASGVSKSLRGTEVLDEVTLTVNPGSIHALVGLNGAGKTTLMRILLGMLAPDSGCVELLGSPLKDLPRSHWGRIGQQIEAPPCYAELTARQNLWAAATLRGVPECEIDQRIERIANEFALTAWLDRRARALSLGTRQKVGLAAALVHDPDVLVLDEPGNALDPLTTVRLRDLLRAAADRGAAVLVSSHHLDEVARMADRISVLHRGCLLTELSPGGVDLERAFFDLILERDQSAPEPATP